MRLSGAAFGYARVPVVTGVELEIRPGDFLGIAGPNGSGKSTLLRGVLGLLPPLAGRVERFTGALGYVPQREALDAAFPLAVEEVAELGACARLRGLRRLARADRELVRESLARVGLLELRRALFSALSGGQRQRALIARALVERPELLVLDEPTTGVDRPTVELLLHLLDELRRERDLAVLLVSHELLLLGQVAPEVLWVEDGAVRRGPAAEVLAVPEASGAPAARRG